MDKKLKNLNIKILDTDNKIIKHLSNYIDTLNMEIKLLTDKNKELENKFISKFDEWYICKEILKMVKLKNELLYKKCQKEVVEKFNERDN